MKKENSLRKSITNSNIEVKKSKMKVNVSHSNYSKKRTRTRDSIEEIELKVNKLKAENEKYLLQINQNKNQQHNISKNIESLMETKLASIKQSHNSSDFELVELLNSYSAANNGFDCHDEVIYCS